MRLAKTGAVFAWLVMLLATLLPHSASAQTAPSGINLTTSPLPISLSVNPGSSVATDIRIKNDSNTTQKLKVSLMKFKAYGEEGKPALIDRQPGDDYFDWVSFSRNSFEAAPNQWETVRMKIATPSSAAFGYYYAVVFSKADEPKKSSKGNTLLGSTAVLVLLDVKSPNAKRSAEIISFSSDRKMYEFLPATFTVRLHNDGNTHVLPHGNIFIKRGSKQVASLVLNAQQGNLLPGSNRAYTAVWDDGFPVYVAKVQGGRVVLDKNGKPVTVLKWDFTKVPKLKFGHYTAQLLAVYDNGHQDVPLEASLSFWVIPWRVLAGIFVIGLFVALGLWTSGRKIYNKIMGLKDVKSKKK
jgi:hypothetical protein